MMINIILIGGTATILELKGYLEKVIGVKGLGLKHFLQIED